MVKLEVHMYSSLNSRMAQTILTPLHQIVLVGIEAKWPVLHGAMEKETLRLYSGVLRESQAVARTCFMVALDPTNRSIVGDRICHMKQ